MATRDLRIARCGCAPLPVLSMSDMAVPLPRRYCVQGTDPTASSPWGLLLFF